MRPFFFFKKMSPGVALLTGWFFYAGCSNQSAPKEKPGGNGISIYVPLSDTIRYIHMGNPDTALALSFIIDTTRENNFGSLFMEYINYYKSKERIDSIVQHLLTSHPQADIVTKKIKDNYENYIRFARRQSEYDLDSSHAISHTPEFIFLIDIKDSVPVQLIKKALADPLVSKEEKGRLAGLAN